MLLRLLLTSLSAFPLMTLSAVVARGDEPNPRSIDLSVIQGQLKTLSQNWSDEESNWFYNVPQGSRLIPYEWFINLEQPGSDELFLDSQNIRSLGYIPRLASPDSAKLPIGFVRDAKYSDGTEGVGVTCAACHTSLVQLGQATYLVDGAPGMGDFEKLLRQLVAALEKTAADSDKFDRFCNGVLGPHATAAEKEDLRSHLDMIIRERSEYNERNLSRERSKFYGPGRVDAFGAIFNQVASRFLEIPENAAPADAPVSYPCLWDAPQHEIVQWNGSARNHKNALGEFLFGTREVGALGRNTGEVLGVFGHVEVPQGTEFLPQQYPSTAVKENLLRVEESLSKLWSPQWPDDFPQINAERRDRGQLLFNKHCVECHHSIERDDPDRHVVAVKKFVGTDLQLIKNFNRTAKTGRLEFRRKSIVSNEKFTDEEPIGLILKHVVERAMLREISISDLKQRLADNPQALGQISPDFRNLAVAVINGESSDLDLVKLQQLLDEPGAAELSHLKGTVDKLLKTGEASSKLQGRGLSLLRQAAGMQPAPGLEGVAPAEEQAASIDIAYKCRPLNGVWATAPYLHNGSVRTLADLLKHPDDRAPKFHVGSIRFDPVNVGFVDDPTFPLFDTSVAGNGKQGHVYGVHLAAEEKLDLIEYLKSL